MSRIVKPLSVEASVTAANTVSSATVVRAYAASAAVVAVKDSEGTTIGSFTMPAATVDYIKKAPTDTIEANVAILCTSVAYAG